MPTERNFSDAVKGKYYPGQQYTAVLMADGEPAFSSGGRAIVFQVTDDSTGDTKGLKFFFLEDKEREKRYEHIGRFLSGLASAHFVNAGFVPDLLWVPENDPAQGAFYPALVMDWAKGPTLHTRLSELCTAQNGQAIAEIADRFKELCLFLLQHKMAHGDLKPENIIIGENFHLTLVDYDGCFIPGFAGQMSPELGTPSFQHPLRKESDFHADLDHFSMLSIYVSLLALSLDPALFLRMNDQQNLLFKPGDYLDPPHSPLFGILYQHPETRGLATFLKLSLQAKSIVIEPIGQLLNGHLPKPELSVSQSVVLPFIGDKLQLMWQSKYAGFVRLDHQDRPLNGAVEITAQKDVPFLFSAGNDWETVDLPYLLQAVHRPEINKFIADGAAIRAGETVILRWEIRHAGKAVLFYGNEERELDLAGDPHLPIGPLQVDTLFRLEVTGEMGKGSANATLQVVVCHPVSLAYTLERKITFPNKPVKLQIRAGHAKKVTLYPCNADLTGNEDYELLVGKLTNYTLIAENDKYSATADFSIDTIPLPVYRKVITLPRPELILPVPHIVLPVPKWATFRAPRPRRGWIRSIVRIRLIILKLFRKHA